jgi:hypothetical protein
VTLDQFLSQLPPQFQGWAASYVPLLAAWTDQQLTAFINFLKAGDIEDAEKALCDGMDATALLAEGQSIIDAWKAANNTSASWIDIGKRAFSEFLSILLSLALGAVGL